MRGRIGVLLFAVLSATAVADESPVGLSEVDAPGLHLYYYDYTGYLVPHAVRTFTNSLAWQKRMLGWTPSEPLTVLLQDTSDYGNASTYAEPRGMMVFDVAPLLHAFETYPASERMYSLMNHELVHVVQGDDASDEDRRWRRFFLGKVVPRRQHPETLLYSYLTTPRFDAPRWWLEGGAVFLETWMAGGLGRAQGGYDEMVFRAMVRDDVPFYDPLGLASRGAKVEFQVSVLNYLYGTRFMTWLAYAYSPEKVVAWIRRDENSARYYADQFQQVFGLPLARAWQDWIAFEKSFQRRNLAEVRKFPITPQRKLAGSPVGSVSRTFYDENTGTLYAGFRYPGTVDYIGALNTHDGSVRPIVEIKRALLYRVTSLAWDPSAETLFFTNNNRAYLSFRDLMAVNVRTGEERTLIKHGRIGEIVIDPVDKALYGVRHEDGLATLVRIPKPYDTWHAVYKFPYGVVPSDLDVSPDGRLLSASVADVGGDEFVRVWNLKALLAGDARPLSQFSFGQSVPESFVFSPDGRYLYGSSYYTGASNIFRYEVATGAVEAVSNAETGFFRPMPLSDGRLVVLDYTGNGFVPVIIDPKPLKDVSAITFLGAEVAAKYPVVKTWQVPPPSTVDETKLVTPKGPYVPLRSLELNSTYPVLQGYKNTVAVGYHADFEDPLQFASVGMTAAYTPGRRLPGDERGHVDITGRYRFLHGEVSWNRPDFYDLFGPTKRSRRGYAAKIGYDWQLVRDDPRILVLSANAEWYDRLDTLPEAQNVQTTFTQLTIGKLALHYNDLRRSLGAVDDEKGVAGNLEFDENRAGGNSIPLLYGNLDFGFPLPIGHSSLWLRSAAGVASGNRNNPVASFYFGAFGNNYVDDGDIKRYREYTSLPGFDINEISARSFVREMAEWNLPPIVFESVGTPGFYLTWVRPAVFVAALWTDPGHASLRKNYTSLGAQADLRFTVLNWADMTLSVGYGQGFQGGRRRGDEWMISLKIM